METKSPPASGVPPQAIVQEIQLPGTPVIFKSTPGGKNGLSLPHGSVKTILAGVVMLFLVGGVGVGVYLVGQQQQIKSRASTNDTLPDNLSAVVPKNVINKPATPSAQASHTATASNSGNLSEIVIPELESSQSASLSGSESADLLNDYDFNQDSVANSVDLSIMYAGWGTPKNDQQKKADINGDGIINGIDYSIFLPFFNKPL